MNDLKSQPAPALFGSDVDDDADFGEYDDYAYDPEASDAVPAATVGDQGWLLDKAIAHLEAGKAEEARRILMERTKSGPPDMSRDAWYLLVVAEAETRRYQASIDILTFMRRVWPADREVEQMLRQVMAQKFTDLPVIRKRHFRDRAHYMDYPKAIYVETTARCNAKCDFCPHQSLERRNDAMDDSLFSKILDDLGAIPPHVRFAIGPYFISEPFIDKKIFDRMAQINERLPNADIVINTNFNIMPKNFFERMREIKNIRWIRVSLFSTNKQEYEAVYKVDHDRTVANLLALLDFNRRERITKSPIVLSRCSTGDGKDGEFFAGCAELLKDFEKGKDYAVFCGAPKNGVYDGDLTFGANIDHEIPYHKPCENWFKLFVTVNGVVALCCMDPEAKYSLGDVKTQNLLSIYNSGWFRTTRETALTRESVFPCNKCDYGHSRAVF
ncbi:MAG: SPASM domain-containing protein [Rhodospirillales bacterium]